MPANFAKIEKLRKKAGLTKEEAAKKAGFKEAQRWHDLEVGRFPDPRISTLEKVAKALGVPIEELLK
jgi:transcriptional regulator with XRE-family HTH domain